MSARIRDGTAKKACTRCSTQKRRCDKGLPECGLCVRLRQPCKYEVSGLPSSGRTLSPSPRPEIFPSSGALTPSYIKHAILQRLGPLTSEDVFSKYSDAIESWFPIVSRLQSRIPPSWSDTSLDLILLCLSIVLLTRSPPPSPEENDDSSEFKSTYLCIKSWLSLTEGLGLNSLEIIQARILVTLFEVAHGFYPAAYISIGATLRAADALDVHPGVDASTFHSSNDETKRAEIVWTWCGILILDRYIAMESGSIPSLTRSRTNCIHEFLKPTFCPTQLEQDRSSSLYRLSRMFEASALVDKIHNANYNPTAEAAFNMEEIMLTVGTSNNLQTILLEEVREDHHIYSGGLGLCNTGLLLAMENGSKVLPLDNASSTCNSIAITELNALVATITSIVEPFILGTQNLNFNILPPFVTFLVYKAAAIVTERLWMDINPNEGLRKLRTLRGFLKLVSTRWLACERYLKLLNEDTTPRILKAIEQG
ncbi:hypothetical protein BDZ45DRAFT_582934 [Acephala macrosclerotiorum]|nr:hypothetical protein BDZ45DRAFT_582934 [Acephala macrosclerotiorum]